MQFSGRGKYFFANGDRYEGEFDNGERDGFGIIFYASGGRRSGVWSQDKLVGEASSRSMENTGLSAFFPRDSKKKNIVHAFVNYVECPPKLD